LQTDENEYGRGSAEIQFSAQISQLSIRISAEIHSFGAQRCFHGSHKKVARRYLEIGYDFYGVPFQNKTMVSARFLLFSSSGM